MKEAEVSRYVCMENSMRRWMCNRTRREWKSTAELTIYLGTKSIVKGLCRDHPRWFGHVERSKESSWLMISMTLCVEGWRARDRQQKMWEEGEMMDLRDKGLSRGEAGNGAA